jgi:hypothetical protein
MAAGGSRSRTTAMTPPLSPDSATPGTLGVRSLKPAAPAPHTLTGMTVLGCGAGYASRLS